MALRTEAAESSEISRSPLRPPKRIPIRNFFMRFQCGRGIGFSSITGMIPAPENVGTAAAPGCPAERKLRNSISLTSSPMLRPIVELGSTGQPRAAVPTWFRFVAKCDATPHNPAAPVLRHQDSLRFVQRLQISTPRLQSHAASKCGHSSCLRANDHRQPMSPHPCHSQTADTSTRHCSDQSIERQCRTSRTRACRGGPPGLPLIENSLNIQSDCMPPPCHPKPFPTALHREAHSPEAAYLPPQSGSYSAQPCPAHPEFPTCA